MGREKTVSNYPCGCKETHKYDDCCGMGAIAGTESREWEHCREHKDRAQTLGDRISRAAQDKREAEWELHEFRMAIMRGDSVRERLGDAETGRDQNKKAKK